MIKILKTTLIPVDHATTFGKILIETDIGTFLAVVDSAGGIASVIKYPSEDDIVKAINEYISGEGLSLRQMQAMKKHEKN